MKATARKAGLIHAIPNIAVSIITSLPHLPLPLSREQATTVWKEALATDFLWGRASSSLGFSLWICKSGHRLCFGDYGAGSLDC